jgi:hypothetical protein
MFHVLKTLELKTKLFNISSKELPGQMFWRRAMPTQQQWVHRRTLGRAQVAHTCNPSYSGDRDQEDWSSKPAWANSLRDSILKKHITEKGWWSGSRCRSWVQTPVPQKTKMKTKQNKNREELWVGRLSLFLSFRTCWDSAWVWPTWDGEA